MGDSKVCVVQTFAGGKDEKGVREEEKVEGKITKIQERGKKPRRGERKKKHSKQAEERK